MEQLGEAGLTQVFKTYAFPFMIMSALILPVVLFKPKIGIWLICFAIPISPSILVGRSEVRDITLRFEDLIFLGVLAGWLIRHKMRMPADGLGYKVVRYLFLLALIHATSTFIHFSKVSQIFFLLKYIQYWSYFLLAYSLLGSKEDVRKLLVAYFLGVLVVLIYWFSDVLQGKIGNEVRFPFHRRFAGRENVGIFALGIMAFSLPFFLNMKSVGRFLFLIFFALASVVYFRTLSRASYLAGLTWFVFVILFFRRRDLFLAMLLMVAISPFLVPDYVIDRIIYTFTGGGGGTIIGRIYVESSGFVRIERWKYFFFEQLPTNIITLLFGHGVLGVGLMDNQYLRVWGEAGTIGFVIFVIILRTLWRLYHKVYESVLSEDVLKSMVIGVMCWFVGILVHMIPANTLVILQTSETFWLMTGAMAALERIYALQRGSGSTSHELPERYGPNNS